MADEMADGTNQFGCAVIRSHGPRTSFCFAHDGISTSSSSSVNKYVKPRLNKPRGCDINCHGMWHKLSAGDRSWRLRRREMTAIAKWKETSIFARRRFNGKASRFVHVRRLSWSGIKDVRSICSAIFSRLCLQFVHDSSTTRPQLVHHSSTTRPWLVHDSSMTRTWLVHDSSTTHSRLVHDS